MLLPVYAYGSPILRQVAEDIDQSYEGLNELVDNMFETMHAASGVGLAAPQVGIPIRLFIVDARIYGDDDESLRDFKRVFVNAHVIERTGEEEPETEGCLSIPHIHEDVLRPSFVKMNYTDLEFNEVEEVFEGMAARIIQHEYDHLDGIMFTDKLSPLKKRLLKSKLRDISNGNIKVNYRMIYPNRK